MKPSNWGGQHIPVSLNLYGIWMHDDNWCQKNRHNNDAADGFSVNTVGYVKEHDKKFFFITIRTNTFNVFPLATFASTNLMENLKSNNSCSKFETQIHTWWDVMAENWQQAYKWSQ